MPSVPAHDAAAERHDRLAASLGISGWNRFRLVDWPPIRRPLLTGFAFAMALSLGDLGVIALFGSDALKTLPFLLLERMGSYRTADAAGLALIIAARVPVADAARRPFRQGAGMSGVPVRLDGVSFSYGEAVFSFDVAFERAGDHRAGRPERLRANRHCSILSPASRRRKSGRVLIGDADVTALPPSARPVSMIFQENNLFAHLDVAANVGLGISPALRLTAADREQDLGLRSSAPGLAGKEKRLPRELSGGERQRVALARALVRDRPVLLLDEPFASLGPALRGEMLDLLVSVQRERQMTTLLVTHHPEDARRASQKDGLSGGRQCRALQATRCRFSELRVPTLSGATSVPNGKSSDHDYLPARRHNLHSRSKRVACVLAMVTRLRVQRGLAR